MGNVLGRASGKTDSLTIPLLSPAPPSMSIRPSLYGTPDFPVPRHALSQSARVTSPGRDVYAEICMDIPSVTYRLLELIRYVGGSVLSRLGQLETSFNSVPMSQNAKTESAPFQKTRQLL